MEIELKKCEFEGNYTNDGYDEWFSLECYQENCKFHRGPGDHCCEIELKDDKLICKSFESKN